MLSDLEEYYPKKLGLRYNPPAIVIQYYLSVQGKTMYHKILVPTLELETQIITAAIRKEHSPYFYMNRITEGNIRKLVDKLKRRAQGRQIEFRAATVAKTSDLNSQPHVFPLMKEVQQCAAGALSPRASQKQETGQQNNYLDEEFQEFEQSASQSSLAGTNTQKLPEAFQFLQQQIEVGKPKAKQQSRKAPLSQTGFQASKEESKQVDPMKLPGLPAKQQMDDGFEYL